MGTPQCQRRVHFTCGTVHWLKKEMLKIELLVQFGTCPLLRENKFQLMSRTKLQFRLCFGADADPIDVGTGRLRSIRFDRDLESDSMESVDQRLV